MTALKTEAEQAPADAVTVSDFRGDLLDATLEQAPRVSAAIAAGRRVLPLGTELAGGRFTIRGMLGEGGMGVVYEAYDTERTRRVALKTLTRMDPVSVFRLKNEFRVLAGVSHENLIKLHGLFVSEKSWFFTMDLVEGEHFDEWVRPEGGLDEARLRAALPQLAAAVRALHDAGKLHRDLKPSNVLVTPQNRVVVLDFGLAVEPDVPGASQALLEEGLSGTPAYMAPEQAMGKAASPASDLYALGAMLFEALTGHLPFEGNVWEMLVAKQRSDAPLASTRFAGAPRDLEALCARLLARDPAQRGDAAELCRSLGLGEDTARGPGLRPSYGPQREPLLGREAELGALRDASAASAGGQPVVLFVSGESGMGKSHLVGALLEELHRTGEAVVLAGRCYERESVPFKGLDSLIDELSRYLRRLPREQAAALLPRDVFALSRLFPVLDRIDVVARAPKEELADPLEVRRRAFAAFGELVAKIRERAPVCAHIDDVQWLDTDSVLFLRALLVHAAPAPVLLVLSHRSENAERNAALSRVLDAVEGNSKIALRKLFVGPLSPAASAELARRLLPADAPWLGEAPAEIALESGGSPFFVGELARYVSRHRDAPERLAGLSLATALRDQFAALSPAQRRLLQVSALTGRPLPAAPLLQAASAGHAELDWLCDAHLLRLADLGGDRSIECYHDRVRESVALGLTAAERALLSTALVESLEPRSGIDPELLASCFEGAGQPARAAEYAARAAEQAVAAMAFEHAAELYRKALRLDEVGGKRNDTLRIALADALEQAGRGKQAADTYLEAAQNAGPDLAFELERRATGQLLVTGHVEEGTALLASLFARVGMKLPSSHHVAMLRLLLTQVALRVRGLGFEPRAANELAPSVLRKLDTAWAAVSGLSHAPLIAACVTDDYLRLALDAGEPSHLARALGNHAHYLSFADPAAGRRISRLFELAHAQAAASADPLALAVVSFAETTAANNRGRWAEARAHAARTVAVVRSAARAAPHYVESALFMDQIAAFQRGDFVDLMHTTRGAVEDGFSRDRIFVAAMLSGISGAPAWLCGDDSAGFERNLATARRRWGNRAEPGWPDYLILFGEVVLDLYRGEVTKAHAAVEREWPRMASSIVVRAEIALSAGLFYRGAAAVAALRSGRAPAAKRAREIAEGCVKKCAKLGFPCAPAYRATIEAGLALHAGDRTRARSLLRAAIAGFDTNEMAMYAAAARRRLGQLTGGSEGERLLSAGDDAMRARRVANLEAMTEMLCPGCGPS